MDKKEGIFFLVYILWISTWVCERCPKEVTGSEIVYVDTRVVHPQAARGVRRNPVVCPAQDRVSAVYTIIHFLATFHCQKASIGCGVESDLLGSVG